MALMTPPTSAFLFGRLPSFSKNEDTPTMLPSHWSADKGELDPFEDLKNADLELSPMQVGVSSSSSRKNEAEQDDEELMLPMIQRLSWKSIEDFDMDTSDMEVLVQQVQLGEERRQRRRRTGLLLSLLLAAFVGTVCWSSFSSRSSARSTNIWSAAPSGNPVDLPEQQKKKKTLSNLPLSSFVALHEEETTEEPKASDASTDGQGSSADESDSTPFAVNKPSYIQAFLP